MNESIKTEIENTDNLNKKMSINKTPGIKKAILISRPKEIAKNTKYKEKYHINNIERVWKEKKSYLLPLMPNDADEKNIKIGKEYRCSYCDQLSDDQTLECKICSRVAHIDCLYRRGHLNSSKVSKKIEWSCSDCCDLSKCLNDDEMRKIINQFDELDVKKNCFVTYYDYMDVKKKLVEQEGEMMTEEKYLEEEKKFRLMDKDSSGSITWNEFLEYEAANLLAKKNKVELSNYLTMKELVSAKKLFLSYDKENLEMINKEDSKKCYIEYIQRLRLKLGPVFSEHISNCIELFGLSPQGEIKTNSAKTIWSEFIRKMTILLLYDRLNSIAFTPKYWKPGVWYSVDTSQTYRSNLSSRAESILLPFIENSLTKKNDKKVGQNLKENKFGSNEFVIRSNRLNNNSSLSINEDLFGSDDEVDVLVNESFKPKFRPKLSRSHHQSFNLKTNRIFKSLNNQNLESNSLTSTRNNIHLPNIVNKANSDSFSNISQNYFSTNKKNNIFSKINESNKIDLKYQNELNFVNNIIANY